jgi:cellulose synthase (UDP-forming)
MPFVEDVPFAPVPVSVRPTKLRLGSWFQARPAAVKFVATLASLTGASYLCWRVIFTSEGVPPNIFWPLFLAEVFGFATFLMLVYEAWETPGTPRLNSLELKTTILIATYNEEIDIVEPSIVGALKVRGDTEVWLCDDGRRPEMQALAIRYGINYQTRADNLHAKAGNINAVLPKLTSDLVLILDADHVPSPDILEALSGYFIDPKVVLAQSAHSFRNHNSVMHEETGRHEQSLFFDVLLPGRNRHESVFWCGSAALIRLSALRVVGGVATKTSTEDFETSLLMQIKGYKIRYHNEHLIQGLAPDTLPAYVTQRARWAEGTLSAFRPGYALPLNRNLKLRQRISYIGAFLYYVTPLQRLVYSAYVVLVGIFGVIPISQANVSFIAIWLSYVILTLFAVVALERGTTQPFEGVRNTFISLEAFLRAIPILFTKKVPGFKVTPKNEVDHGGWSALFYIRLPLFIITMNLSVVLLRWFDYLLIAVFGAGFMPELPIYASLAMTFFAVLEIVIIGRLARRLYKRKQLRKLWRFPVKLNAVVDGAALTVVDLHQRGLALYGPKQILDSQIPLDITLYLTDLAGNQVISHGKFQPKNSRTFASNANAVRIGGTVNWNSDQCLTNVIEHCYIVEPYRAKNQFLARRSPRVMVQLNAELAQFPATVIDLSLGGVALQVSSPTGFEIDSVLPVSIWVGEQLITGKVTVRNSNQIRTDLYRVGCEVQWSSTQWLSQFLTIEHRAIKKTPPLVTAIRR